MSKRKQRKRCPHVDVIGIYGDAINHCGGYRNFCRDCGRYLDGQVSISVDRQALIELAEWDRVHEALGSPGELGESKVLASLAEVERLKQEVKDMRDANAKRARDNKWPTVL